MVLLFSVLAVVFSIVVLLLLSFGFGHALRSWLQGESFKDEKQSITGHIVTLVLGMIISSLIIFLIIKCEK